MMQFNIDFLLNKTARWIMAVVNKNELPTKFRFHGLAKLYPIFMELCILYRQFNARRFYWSHSTCMLRALSTLRGLRGAPEVPPLCRETQSLGQQMLNATVGINGLSANVSNDHYFLLQAQGPFANMRNWSCFTFTTETFCFPLLLGTSYWNV